MEGEKEEGGGFSCVAFKGNQWGKKENSIKVGFTRIWVTHPCELPSKQPPHTTLSFHSLPKFP